VGNLAICDGRGNRGVSRPGAVELTPRRLPHRYGDFAVAAGDRRIAISLVASSLSLRSITRGPAAHRLIAPLPVAVILTRTTSIPLSPAITWRSATANPARTSSASTRRLKTWP
jgi:hypothetical protein